VYGADGQFDSRPYFDNESRGVGVGFAASNTSHIYLPITGKFAHRGLSEISRGLLRCVNYNFPEYHITEARYFAVDSKSLKLLVV